MAKFWMRVEELEGEAVAFPFVVVNHAHKATIVTDFPKKVEISNNFLHLAQNPLARYSYYLPPAQVVKLVDTSDLGSGAARCVGSSPILGNFL